MDNLHPETHAPTALNVTVAAPGKRQVRRSARPREYLTEREIEKLMDAAGGNRWGHRDATAVLLAYRHGLSISSWLLCAACPCPPSSRCRSFTPSRFLVPPCTAIAVTPLALVAEVRSLSRALHSAFGRKGSSQRKICHQAARSVRPAESKVVWSPQALSNCSWKSPLTSIDLGAAEDGFL